MGRSSDLKTGHIRSGDEPMHARSALWPRFWLALFGLVNGVSGVIVFAVLRSPPFVVVSIVLAVVSAVNLAVVARHIRQGPHYQPGRTIPPYRPVEDHDPARRPEPRKPTPAGIRHRRYFVLMGLCMVLIVLAWSWVRFYSVAAAGVMTLVAALIPPFAAVVTNADSPIIRGGGEDPVQDPEQDSEQDPEQDPEQDRPGGLD